MVVAMNQPREDLRRLASYVIDARIKAGFSTRKEFAAATGVTARTLGKLENASERVSNDTLARVARELQWTPDSPARVMAGGEPVPAARAALPFRPVIPSPPAAPGPEQAAGEILADLLARYPGDEVIQTIGAQAHMPSYERTGKVLRWLERQGDPATAVEVRAGLVARYPDDEVLQTISRQSGKRASMVAEEILDWLCSQGPAVPQARNGTVG